MTESTAGALSQLNLAFGFIAETIEESPTANPVGPPRKGPVDSVELQGGSRLQDEFETIWPRHQGYNPVTPLGTARVKGLTAKQTTHLYRCDLKIRKSGHTMSRLSGSSLGLANSHQTYSSHQSSELRTSPAGRARASAIAGPSGVGCKNEHQ